MYNIFLRILFYNFYISPCRIVLLGYNSFTNASMLFLSIEANFIVSLLLLGGSKVSSNGFMFEVNVPWIKAIGSNYHVGVDGLSLWLLVLTTFIMPIAVISTWKAVEKKHLAFFIFLLLLESAMIGVFCSLDLLVFYL